MKCRRVTLLRSPTLDSGSSTQHSWDTAEDEGSQGRQGGWHGARPTPAPPWTDTHTAQQHTTPRTHHATPRHTTPQCTDSSYPRLAAALCNAHHTNTQHAARSTQPTHTRRHCMLVSRTTDTHRTHSTLTHLTHRVSTHPAPLCPSPGSKFGCITRSSNRTVELVYGNLCDNDSLLCPFCKRSLPNSAFKILRRNQLKGCKRC